MNALDHFHLAGTGALPSIRRHTDEQLELAIRQAERLPEFYVLLHGIDAYQERRRRRSQRKHAAILAGNFPQRDPDDIETWRDSLAELRR